MKTTMKSRWAAAIVALLLAGCGTPTATPTPDAALPMAAGAAPSRTAPGATRTAVPPRDHTSSAAQATLQAERQAFEAAQRDQQATAQARPPVEKRPGTPVTSCPRQLPPDSAIGPAGQAVPGLRARLTSHATVIVQQELYYLNSGARSDNPQQGLIHVYHPLRDPCAQPNQRAETGVYPTPEERGAVTLTAVRGALVEFTTADGATGTFNVVTKEFSR